MGEGELCAVGLHPGAGDVPCAECVAPGGGHRCRSGRHDLTLPGATYTLKDGRSRCTECKKARAAKARLKRKRAKAEAEPGVAQESRDGVEEEPSEIPTIAVPPRGFGRPTEVARYRHAVLIRMARGLM